MSSEKKKNNYFATMLQRIAPREAGTRKKMLYLFGGAMVIVAIVVGYPFYVHMMTHESTEDAFVEAQVVSISPRVAGHVARVLVTDNQRVEKGALLAELDSRDFEVALNIAQARLESALAEKERSAMLVQIARNKMVQQGASLKSTLAVLAQAKAGVAEFEAGHDRDEHDFVRMKKVADVGAVSRQELEHVRAQAAMSRAKLHSAQKQVDTESAKINQAKASVSVAENELRQAYALVDISAAAVREAKAEVERARLNLSYTSITAPCAGFVTKKAVEPGTYAQVGQKLFSIVDSNVWIVANFKETQISNMHPGQPVAIEVDAYPSVSFAGHVDSIQRGTGSRFTLLPPENATGNFIKVVQRVPVKIVLDATDETGGYLMAPGMSVVPSVDVAVHPSSKGLSATLGSGREKALQ